MTRAIPRHPYQLLDMNELVVGQSYAFVSYFHRFMLNINYYMFGGIIKDSGDVDETATVDTFVVSPDTTKNIVTIHLDGWNPIKSLVRKLGDPVLVYWKRSGNATYDWLYTYLSNKKNCNNGPIVVPERHWKDDPQIYSNPIKRKTKLMSVSGTEMLDAASWEQKMRQRTHDAMAKMFE